MNTLYQREDIELPYNIDSRFFKFVQDGETKEKYEQRWVVLTENVNSFIEALPVSYESLALSDVSRDDRGPLTVVTANYGDTGLSEDYNGDGELTWWTLSSGIYTYHIKRWVDNNPTAIKEFCDRCMTSYGYEKNEVSVSCNPIAGEPRVMCEGTFTPDVETDIENDPTTDWGDGEEETETEEAESFQCSSTIDTLTPSAALYLEKKLGVYDGRDIVKIINAVEAGEVSYREAGSMGGRITTNGWYSTDDTNPNALDNPVYSESGDCTKDNVDKARVLLKNIPDVMVPSLRVTVVKKIKSADKVSMSTLTGKMSNAGSMSDSISSGNISVNAPAIQKGWDAEGTEYPIKKTVWLNEGASFDAPSVRKRSSLTTGKVYYEGTMSESYRSVSYLEGGACESSTSTMSI